MSVGLAVMLYVRFATPIAWTWHVAIGSLATVAVGLIFAGAAPAAMKESNG
jgi:hypothetical protein